METSKRDDTGKRKHQHIRKEKRRFSVRADILIGSALAVLIAGGVFLLFMYFNRSDNTQDIHDSKTVTGTVDEQNEESDSVSESSNDSDLTKTIVTEASETTVEKPLPSDAGVDGTSAEAGVAEVSPEPTAFEDTIADNDVFSLFEGYYSFASGVGFWATVMQIQSDGTFTGHFHDTDHIGYSDNYDWTRKECEFSGRFINPRQINDYTYSFELGELTYENEPGTDTTETRDDGIRIHIIYVDAYGLNNGTKMIYAYTPDAPVAELPDQFMSWVRGRLRERQDESRLSYKCLYTDGGFGWTGPKEEE